MDISDLQVAGETSSACVTNRMRITEILGNLAEFLQHASTLWEFRRRQMAGADMHHLAQQGVEQAWSIIQASRECDKLATQFASSFECTGHLNGPAPSPSQPTTP